MALIQCPDCGKMVSPRVEACPFCGCPAKYFNVEQENQQEQDKEIPEEKSEVEVEKTEMAEMKKVVFNFNGMEVSMPEDIKDIAKELGPFLVRAQKAADAIDKMYRESRNLENVLSSYSELADDHIFAAVDEAVRILYGYHIYMSNRDFLGKYQNTYALDVVPLIKDIYDQYEEIMGVQEEFKEYRAAQKASRSHWQGGGFGLSGAIKGAAQATALNAASSVLHAPVDMGRKASDNTKIRNALDNIYKDPNTKNRMVNVTYNAVRNVYLALYKELCDQGAFETWQNINPKKAFDVYQSTEKHETDEIKKLQKYIVCLNLGPTNRIYHKKVYSAMLEGDNNFEEWIHFWGLEPFFNQFSERKASLKRFTTFLFDRGMDEFDYTSGYIKNLTQLRKVVYDYWKETGEDIPEQGRLANLVKAYFQMATKDGRNYGESELIEWIPEDVSLDEFMEVIQQDIRYYQMPFFAKILDYKGKDEGKKPKKKITADGSMIILYDNTSLLGVGDKGYAMTSTSFWDIKNDIKIALQAPDMVGAISRNKKFGIYLTDNQQEIFWTDNSSSHFDGKLERYEYVANLIEEIRDRYGNSIAYANDTERKPCPHCGKLILPETKFCNYCGESTEEKKICPNCGQQISLVAKFCNYCGEKIEEEGS